MNLSNKLDLLIFDSFIKSLTDDPLSKSIWNEESEKDLSKWTSYASRKLAILLHDTFKLDSCSKGFHDSNFKYEYLTIDVCAHDNSWAPLKVAIELENNFFKIDYSAWKLLSLDCEYRILITYYNPNVNIPNNLEALLGKIFPIVNRFNTTKSNKRFLLIYGNSEANPLTVPWENIFKKHFIIE